MCIYIAGLWLASVCVAMPLEQRSVGNATSSQNGSSNAGGSAWVSAPNRRGTYDLIMSCLLTLVLCAWTAYHPNIPAKVSPWALIGRRLKWVLVAVFAPEAVLMVASSQLKYAWRLMKEINGIKEIKMMEIKIPMTQLFPESCFPSCIASSTSQSEPSPTIRGSHTWPSVTTQSWVTKHALDSSKHSVKESLEETKQDTWKLPQAFFALSGGIAVDSESFYPHERITFHPKGILTLAKLGILPDVDEDDVNDRSKADGFTKVLVCLQAGWFFVQSIARVQQGLPLTLLEIHTNAHIFCAFLLYALWAYKPYDVGAPLLCTDERVINMAAFFASEAHEKYEMGLFDGRQFNKQQCSMTDYVTLEHIKSAHQSPVYSVFSWRTWYNEVLNDLAPKFWPRKYQRVDEARAAEHLKRANKAVDFLRSMGCHIGWDDRCPSMEALEHREGLCNSIKFSGNKLITLYSKSIPEGGLDEVDLVVEKLLESPKTGFKRKSSKDKPGKVQKGRENSTMRRIFLKSLARIEKNKLIKWIFIVFSAIYGGAHLSAWNCHFPTAVEMWMWRIGGISLAAGPFLWVVSTFLIDLDWSISEEAERRNDHRKAFWWTVFKWLARLPIAVGIVACAAVHTIWIPARFYILVEAFASLRSPAPGTYRTSNWLNYIPHAN